MVCKVQPPEDQSKDLDVQKKDESKPPEEPVRRGKGKGNQSKGEESQKVNESKKKTPENPWNRFQQRMKGSGLGGEKKLLSALYREEQRALKTLTS